MKTIQAATAERGIKIMATAPDDFYAEDDIEEQEEEITQLEKLLKLSVATGDISGVIDDDQLASIGSSAVNEYNEDLASRGDWERVVKDALESAAQEAERDPKDWPWKNASDIRYPLLTVAALQFNARAYPAVVKGDEAVGVKVVGQDKGRPQMQQTPQGLVPMQDEQGQVVWAKQPGAKTKRAMRVKEMLNAILFYRVDDWEEDTDVLLTQLPIVGCAFRKCYWDSYENRQFIGLVPALNLVVPMSATSLEAAARITEVLRDVSPIDILEKQRSEHYRYVDLAKEGEQEDWADRPRDLIQQCRLIDLDEDGLPEPYIVTVDVETQRVLRIEPNFGPEHVHVKMAGFPLTLDRAIQTMTVAGLQDIEVLRIKRTCHYVKYDFFPHPDGKFYGIGLGHLLAEIGDVINTAINQLQDTATAAAAGGGFVASGISLQGAGGRTGTLRFGPGEYKVVDVPGGDLRNGLIERTIPQPSPVTFQVLDMMLSAAKDISSVKDVITGEASNNGQVGTTLALIEQGLQVFTAIYKRVYRSLKKEFTMLAKNVADFGGEEMARYYDELLDDPEADFEADFNAEDMDVRPISDPSSVTKMQKMARAQFLMGTIEPMAASGGNPREIMRRVYEAAEIEDIEALLPEPQPEQPNPEDMAKAKKNEASAALDMAKVEQTQAETSKTAIEAATKKIEAEAKAFELGRQAA